MNLTIKLCLVNSPSLRQNKRIFDRGKKAENNRYIGNLPRIWRYYYYESNTCSIRFFTRYLVDRFKFISIYCVCQREKTHISITKIPNPRQGVAREDLKKFFRFSLEFFTFVERNIPNNPHLGPTRYRSAPPSKKARQTVSEAV